MLPVIFSRLILFVSLAALSVTVLAQERGQFLGAKETEMPAWFKESFLDFEEDIAEAAANGKRVMLFFHQDGCPYCNRLVEQNFSQKDIAEKARESFAVIAINMWGDREVVTVGGQQFTEKSLAEALDVNYTPTLLFFDEQGQVVLRINGYYPPENFRVALDYVAGHEEAKGSFRDYLAARATNPAAAKLNDEPFFRRGPFDLSRNKRAAHWPLAVYFEQGQCSNCDHLHQKVLADETTRALAQRFDSVQLHMWSDTPVVVPDGRRISAKAWARELGVHYAPSVIFFDFAGREVMRTDAFLKTFHFQSVLDYVLTGAYRKEPSFQRFISARADALREKGIDVDLWR